MKRLALLIIIIFIAEFSFSQTDYRNGYIITNAGDTLIGLIDYREQAKGYKSCVFKVSNDQNPTNYEPNSIIGYGFENDKFFQSREISIKNQSSQVVFLEVIIKGLVSLYKYENIYFIEKGNDGLQQLINETKEVNINGKRLLKNTNQYIATINILLFDCAEIKRRIQKIKLDEKALTKLIEDYNQCKGEPSNIFKAKKHWTQAIIGVTGGLNTSQLDFENNPRYEHLAGKFGVSKSPMIGVSIDILWPRLSERVSAHTGLLYLTSKYYGYSLYNRSSSVERNYITIELQELKIPIGIRYTFPKREFTPYFNAGISSTIHLSSNPIWVQEVEMNNAVYTNEREALTIKNLQFGLWGGFGVVKFINKKLNVFLELRYERTDGVAPIPVDPNGLNSKISNFQILIGIRPK